MSRHHSNNRHPTGFWYGTSPCYNEDNQAQYPQGYPYASGGQEQGNQQGFRGAPYLIDQNAPHAPHGEQASQFQQNDPRAHHQSHGQTYYPPIEYKVLDHDKEYVIETQAYFYAESKKIPMIISVVGGEVRLAAAIGSAGQQKAPEYRIAIPYGVNFSKISAVVEENILRIHLAKYVEVIKPTVQGAKQN
ncbi:MAG: hypothetical protein LCH26_04220 [Proteobacteria bacterium]|nr:hypothetical protein [Pseudomonadota bacterium]